MVRSQVHHDPLFGLSAGFLALCRNFVIVIGGSLPSAGPGRDHVGRERAAQLAMAFD
jgi:hypothetical protein